MLADDGAGAELHADARTDTNLGVSSVGTSCSMVGSEARAGALSGPAHRGTPAGCGGRLVVPYQHAPLVERRALASLVLRRARRSDPNADAGHETALFTNVVEKRCILRSSFAGSCIEPPRRGSHSLSEGCHAVWPTPRCWGCE